jgi:rubredoxin
MKKYICQFCGFVYDEAQGMPDEGVAPGTRWEDVPEDWECPDCGNPKSAFVMDEL